LKTKGNIVTPLLSVADPEGGGGDVRPPPLKKKKNEERERERGWFSVPLLSISAFIHSPVKCNKSLYIFTRCIALLVYLIAFELLKQSTITVIRKQSDIIIP
jgi:hypothetical protein